MIKGQEQTLCLILIMEKRCRFLIQLCGLTVISSEWSLFCSCDTELVSLKTSSEMLQFQSMKHYVSMIKWLHMTWSILYIQYVWKSYSILHANFLSINRGNGHNQISFSHSVCQCCHILFMYLICICQNLGYKLSILVIYNYIEVCKLF